MAWTCKFKGCQSSPEQIAALRQRRPNGFPHDEDPSLRVCNLCRSRPIEEEKDDGLDAAFLDGIKGELASLEKDENGIQALSQVLRYYVQHASQLSKVLADFTTKTCFPWEVMPVLHLVDDILLMDRTGQYKIELSKFARNMTVTGFKKVRGSDEKRDVANLIKAWKELRNFDDAIFQDIIGSIRKSGDSESHILDEVMNAESEDEEEGFVDELPQKGLKRKREEQENGDVESSQASNGHSAGITATREELIKQRDAKEAQRKLDTSREAAREKMLQLVTRINSTPLEKPFDILGMAADQEKKPQEIRKAYRRIALLVHPDKNPGNEDACKDALQKLQQARERAETDLQRSEFKGNDTRAAAKTEAAASDMKERGERCKYEGCDLPPCKQCANDCCVRNITHCHWAAKNSKNGLQCFFHPPPRAWARNA